MGLTLDTAPALEPITLAEAKAHLRITSTDDDVYITTLITVAREWAETYTARALITQTWDWTLDGFPAEPRVPKPELQSILSINYVDTDGDSQLLAASKYQVDISYKPARVMPAYGEAWPATRSQFNAVTVQFKAGYGDSASDVPAAIRQAMLLIIGELYERREDAIVGVPISKVHLAAENLAADYRIHSF